MSVLYKDKAKELEETNKALFVKASRLQRELEELRRVKTVEKPIEQYEYRKILRGLFNKLFRKIG